MIQIRSHHFLNDRDLVIADLHLSVSDHPKLCYTIRFVKQYEKLILYRILNPPAPNIKKDWMTFSPLNSDPESIPIPSMENSTTERLTSSGGIIIYWSETGIFTNGKNI